MKPARCSPSPRSRTRRGGRACRCPRTRRNRQARSRWMWKSWVSICCHWRGTSYMRPRESGRCMCAAGCGWRSCSTAWKFVACNAGLWGGQSCPQAGLPAGWTRWKAGPQPERLPHISNSGHSHFLSRQILLVEAVVLVVQIYRRSLDEHLLDLGARLQRVSVGNNQVGPLAFFDGAELVAYTPDLGRIERDGLESFVVRQAETHRRRRFIRQVAGIIFRSRPEARESKFDARLR